MMGALYDAKCGESIMVRVSGTWAGGDREVCAIAGHDIKAGQLLVTMADGRVAPVDWLDPDQEYKARDRHLKERVLELRKQGKSIEEIAEEVFE